MAFVRVCSAEEVWDGEMRGITIQGRRVLLVHAGGELHAYEDACPHRGMPLSQGKLADCTLVCSFHGWSYDVRSGRGINPESARLRAFPVRVEGDDVLVDVPRSEPVGPVLQVGSRADAIVRAIRAENPTAEVLDRGAYLRVLVPGRCRVTREAIERECGGSFELPGDLEAVMSSFKGRFEVSASEATWWSP
jgi:toluene monooxygenase system ferredoxin subunit